MLVLIHVVFLAGKGPFRLAGDLRHRRPADGAHALGAHDVIGVFIPTVFDLPAANERANTVRVNVVHLEVVENVAALGRNLAAAHRRATERRFVALRPRDLIDAVHGLLHQTVAAEPLEVVPVGDLPLHVAHASRTRAGRRHRLHGTGVIGGVIRDDVADRARFQLVERGDDVVAIAPAKTGHQREVLLLGKLGRLQHVTHAERIHGDGLFAEYMLACFNAGAQMPRPETRRRGQDHHVHAAIDHLLIGIEPEKNILRLHLHLGAAGFHQLIQAFIDALLRDVGHRGQLGEIVGLHGLRRGSSAPATAAHQADLNRVGRRLRADQRGKSRGKSGSARGLQKISTVIFHFCVCSNSIVYQRRISGASVSAPRHTSIRTAGTDSPRRAGRKFRRSRRCRPS